MHSRYRAASARGVDGMQIREEMMSLRDEAAILLSELLRISPEVENQTVNDFIEAIVQIAIDEMERKHPWRKGVLR